MRTFGKWEPLQDPKFVSKLDSFREFNASYNITPETVRQCFDPEETLEYAWLELAEADAMVVAEKVRAST